MALTTAKVKNASPNTGSRCRSGRNGGWLRPTSAWALALLFLGLGLAVFPAAPAQAAIAFDDVNPFSSGGCDPCEWTHTVTTGGSDRILVVAVTGEAKDGQSIVSVTYNGLSLTEIRRDVASDFTASLWYRLNPPTGSAYTISVDLSSSFNKFIGGSLSFTGVDQTDPLDDAANAGFGAQGNSTTPTVDVTTVNADAWIVDAMSGKELPTMVTKTGRTERWVLTPGGGSGIHGAASTLAATTATTYTMDWTFPVAEDWAISAAALKPTGAPSITKAFVPATIAVGGISTLTITIDNSQGGAIPLTGLALNDSFLPTDVVIAAVPNDSTTCGGTLTATAGTDNIDLTGAALAAGASCTLQADVTAASAGAKANNIPAADLNNDEGLDAAADANATLTVGTLPSIAKAFVPSTIAVGGISTLTITIDNSQAGAIALTALALNDSFLPTDLVIAPVPNDSTTCGGTLTATAGTDNIDLTGAALAAGASCTFQADVTAASAGAKANNIPAADLNNDEGLDAAADANATLTVGTLPSIAKAFVPSTIAVGGISTLTITIDNSQAGAIALTGLALNDTFLPTDVVIAAVPNDSTTCGGTLTATAGTDNIDLTGAALAAGATCTLQADVTAATAGAKANNIPAADLNNNEGLDAAADANATLTVGTLPSISKVFTIAN